MRRPRRPRPRASASWSGTTSTCPTPPSTRRPCWGICGSFARRAISPSTVFSGTRVMTIIVQGGRRQSLIAQGGRGVTQSPGKKGPGGKPGGGGSGASGRPMSIVIGTYTGNGTSQDVTTTGIKPDFVWVKGGSNDSAMWTNTLGTDVTKPLTTGLATTSGAITSVAQN